MHRIDAPNAINGQFTDGDPGVGQLATELLAKWHNSVQEELAGIVEAAGVALSDADNGQVLKALTLLFSPTGDVQFTINPSAPAGWVMMDDGSIGPVGSGATTRANADTLNLFLLLWSSIADAWAPVSGGRGASAQADWDAGKTISLPKVLGRALAAAGAGAGLTNRALGETAGTETHQLSIAEMPAHTHPYNETTFVGNSSSGSGDIGDPVSTSVNTGSTGGGASHNNMQPTTFLHVRIKL